MDHTENVSQEHRDNVLREKIGLLQQDLAIAMGTVSTLEERAKVLRDYEDDIAKAARAT